MWLDLAEMKLILDALTQRVQDATPYDREQEARIRLRDYFEEQVARVQKVKDEYDRRRDEAGEDQE